MDKWVKEKGKDFSDGMRAKWDFIVEDYIEEESEEMEPLTLMIHGIQELADERLDALEKRIYEEGCQCGDRKSRGKRKVKE